MAKKIAIAIRKGGVGKTATANNLAAALAMKGRRTLLVDVDEQANATKGFGINPLVLSATLNDLFANDELDPASVVVEAGVKNLHILAGHPHLSRTETGMALQRADPTAPDPIGTLKAILEPLDSQYDFIIFDTPPAINYMTINALAAADELLIPAAASADTEDGIAEILGEYQRAVQRYNPSLRFRGVLVTRLKRTNASVMVYNNIIEAYPEATLPQTIVEATAVDEAKQLNQPVVLYDPESVAAQGYVRIAEMLEGE